MKTPCEEMTKGAYCTRKPRARNKYIFSFFRASYAKTQPNGFEIGSTIVVSTILTPSQRSCAMPASSADAVA